MSLRERVLLPTGTFTGRPSPYLSVYEGDCLDMREFGAEPDLESNVATVEYVYGAAANPYFADLKVFASGSIAKILEARRLDHNLVYVYQGKSADNHGENLGAYGECEQFVEHSQGIGIRPIIATSGFNAGNIQRQYRKLGVGSVIPPELPRVFDARSSQFWTKGRLRWMLCAHIRVNKLLNDGH